MVEHARVLRVAEGRYRILLTTDEREVLQAVLPQLDDLLAGDRNDPSVSRLFPTAYSTDPDRDLEYQLLARDSLADRRQMAIAVVLASLDGEEVDEDQLTAWLTSINSLRLVLGTRLDVTEDDGEGWPDPSDPDAPLWALYGFLAYLLEDIVSAMSGDS